VTKEVKSSAAFTAAPHDHCKKGPWPPGRRHGLRKSLGSDVYHVAPVLLPTRDQNWREGMCAGVPEGQVRDSGHRWGGRADIISRCPLWAALPHSKKARASA